MGTDVSAMVKSITFNGTKFNFGAAPADGHDGQNGADGRNGTDGKTVPTVSPRSSMTAAT